MGIYQKHRAAELIDENRGQGGYKAQSPMARILDSRPLQKITDLRHTHAVRKKRQLGQDIGHDWSVEEQMYLTVCPPRGPGSIPSCGGGFQGIFP